MSSTHVLSYILQLSNSLLPLARLQLIALLPQSIVVHQILEYFLHDDFTKIAYSFEMVWSLLILTNFQNDF